MPNNILLVGGTGTLGANVLNALLDDKYKGNFQTYVLIRNETLESKDDKKVEIIDKIKSKGGKILTGDISKNDEQTLATLLKDNNINTILSAVDYTSLGDQVKLINAAKVSGTVQLFIPSEFSIDGDKLGYGSVLPLADAKLKIREAVISSGLNYLFIVTSVFSEYVLSPFMGVDFTNNTVSAPGSLDNKFSTTTLNDIGYNTVELILSNVRNQKIYLSDALLSWNELADILESITGKKFNRTVKTRQEFEEIIKQNPTDFTARFAIADIDKQVTYTVPLDQAWNQISTVYKTSFTQFAKSKLKPS